MTGRTAGRRGVSARLVLAGLAAAALAVGCAPAPVPPTVPPISGQASETANAEEQDTSCDNPTQSYDPLPVADPASFRVLMDPAVIRIVSRGELRVGVSGDTPLLGSLNPVTGEFEGVDIDLARYLAERMLGDPERIRFVVITANRRVEALERGDVDLVVRATTITCARWELVGFSAEYLQAGQTVLLPRNQDGSPSNKSLADLAGERVCAPRGTSSLDEVNRTRGVIAVPAETHTECLLYLQQGQAEAIEGDSLILAGLASLDPKVVAVSTAPLTTAEPYGVAASKDAVVLIQFTNRALVDYQESGRWQQSYDTWLAPSLGPPVPFQPVYGRRS